MDSLKERERRVDERRELLESFPLLGSMAWWRGRLGLQAKDAGKGAPYKSLNFERLKSTSRIKRAINGRDSKGSGRQANGEGSRFRETKSDKETVCSERILRSKRENSMTRVRSIFG